jgi:hypothetical protein
MKDYVKVPLLNSKGKLRFIEIGLARVLEIEGELSGDNVTSRFYVTTSKDLDYESLQKRVMYGSLAEAIRKSYRSSKVDDDGVSYVVYVVGVVGDALGISGCYVLDDLGFLVGDEKVVLEDELAEKPLEEKPLEEKPLEEKPLAVEGVEEKVEDSLEESIVDKGAFAEEITEGKSSLGFTDTLTYRKNGTFKFDVPETPLELTTEELKSEYERFKKIQGVLRDTSNVDKEERKHLDYVTDASDVYVDKEQFEPEVVNAVTSMVLQGLLPYHYLKSGDMVLNPNGGVLVSSLSKYGISGLEDYNDRYLSVISGVLLSLLMRGKEVHEYNWGTVVMVALTRGLDSNVLYPFVKKDDYKVEDFTKVCSCSNEVLYKEFRKTLVGEPLGSIDVLGLVISTIIDLDLFETSKLGFPSLRDMVTRYELATLVEEV